MNDSGVSPTRAIEPLTQGCLEVCTSRTWDSQSLRAGSQHTRRLSSQETSLLVTQNLKTRLWQQALFPLGTTGARVRGPESEAPLDTQDSFPVMVSPRPLPQMGGVRWGQGNAPLPVSILLKGSPRIPLCAAVTHLLNVDQGPSMSRHSSAWGSPAVFSSTKLTPDGRGHTRHGWTGKPLYTDQRWKDLEERKPGQGKGRLTCGEGVIPCLEGSEIEETFGQRPE